MSSFAIFDKAANTITFSAPTTINTTLTTSGNINTTAGLQISGSDAVKAVGTSLGINPSSTFASTVVAGSVGIGATSAPAYTLDVSGVARSTALIATGVTSTPTVGAIEWGTKTHQTCTDTTHGKGSLATVLFTSGGGQTGTAATTAYSLFSFSNLTLAANTTYIFDSVFSVTLSSANATTATAALQYSPIGGGSLAGYSIGYVASASCGGSLNTTSITPVNSGALTNITSTSVGSSRTYCASVKGMIRTTTAGTIRPSYAWNNAPGGTPSASFAAPTLNFMSLTPIGANPLVATSGWTT